MSCKVGLGLLIALVVDRSDGFLQSGHRISEGFLEGREVFDRGDDVLVDHVDHAHGLDLYGSDIVGKHDGLAGSALLGCHHLRYRVEELVKVSRNTDQWTICYSTFKSLKSFTFFGSVKRHMASTPESMRHRPLAVSCFWLS